MNQTFSHIQITGNWTVNVTANTYMPGSTFGTDISGLDSKSMIAYT